MPLFQNSVIKKYTQELNTQKVQEAYTFYQAYFLDPATQVNIREAKEEQFQEGFLRKLFVKVLGYTLYPDANYNLTTELKNISNSKKVDGAVLIDNKAVAVIELKGTETTDLSKIEAQAFGYKNNQQHCTYVITSNFEKLRFYIDNTIEFIEFNLFTLSREDFNLLWLCLSYKSIEQNIPNRIKEESLSQEDAITKLLYRDYSLFKRELYQNLVALNPQFEPLTLFKKSQKLLDRFLFLFFAEDRQLLPPNSVRLILNDWKDLQERDVEIPLYDRFKKYFEYLNTGYKGKRYDVFAYNGGLFKPDNILDAVAINDQLLYNHTLKLSEYDFVSEVDVNILGHIFENSLNELDEIKAQLEGQEVDKSKTKRKKDGVFYTPKYITKYIVENTVGKLCIEKKTELFINEEDYITDKKRQKKTIQELADRLTTYRNWLLQLTICDPACGSGAFLNQALDFLINEHKYIDELQAKLFGDAMVLSDFENSILENNLYGVDLNEESVEIAKLSLWLRTAQPNRKLNDLNNNIKCGNSLIDDQAVAGEKAFNWHNEFPQIFKAKDKKIWHVTTVTHDTRTSKRMIEYKVRERRADGQMHIDRSIYFNEEEAVKITEIICNIITESNFNCLAYNVCYDHVHLILVCEEEELPNIVRKLKGKSAQKYKELKGISKDETFNLWAQKFDKKEILDEQQLTATISYISNNRQKHGLPDINKGLQPLVDRMVCTLPHALRTEHKGGFDVVIGNPPYLRVQGLRNNFEKETEYYEKQYKSANGRFDIYILFLESSLKLINDKGNVSFILPHKFLISDFGNEIRIFLKNNMAVESILHFGSEMVFADATTYTCIIKLSKNNNVIKYKQIKPSDILNKFEYEITDYNKLTEDKWNFINDNSLSIFKKINSQPWTIKDVFENISQGIVSVGDDIFLMRGHIEGNKFIGYSDKISNKIILEADIVKPLLKGEDVKKYKPLNTSFFCFYPHYIKNGKTLPYEENYLKANFPLAYNYMLPFKEELIEKKIRYKTNPTAWYSLHRSREISLFEQEKIITPEISLGTNMTLDTNNLYHNTKCYSLIKKKNIEEDYLFWLTILNSSLLWFYLSSTGYVLRGGFFTFKTKYLEPFPLPKLPSINLQIPFIEKANLMLSINKELQELSQKLQRSLQRKFEIEGLSTKLQNWYTLTYNEFIQELGKIKIKLSLSQEAEWEDYFLQESKKALELKSKIEATDKEIDYMVYELYGLTEDEITIIESN